jgi:hypothetical protein
MTAIMGPMSIKIEALTIDAADAGAIARWWSEALGWQIVEDDDDEVALVAPDGFELLFINVPEAKSVKNRLHLDLRPDDQAAEVARFEALGARRVDVGQTAEHTWVVLADPEGNEFCILRALTPEESDDG